MRQTKKITQSNVSGLRQILISEEDRKKMYKPMIDEFYYDENCWLFKITDNSMNDDRRGSISIGDYLLCKEVLQPNWTEMVNEPLVFITNHGNLYRKIIEYDPTGALVLSARNPSFDNIAINTNEINRVFEVHYKQMKQRFTMFEDEEIISASGK